jgi:hypothetical protein
MQTIELYGDDDYYVQAVLDGVLYYLHLSWNSEGEFWTFGIETYLKEPLLSGLRIQPNYPLISRYFQPGFPPGEIVVVSDADTVGQSDFVDAFASMVYVTEEELNALI